MRRVIAVVVFACLLTAGTATAHQFVTIDEQPVRASPDGVATIPLSFHETSAATVRIDGLLAVDVVDTDENGRVVVRLDLGRLPDRPSDAVSADGDEVRDPRVNDSAAFGSGNYSLVVEPTTGVGDETRLLIEEPAGDTSSDDAADDSPTDDTSRAVAGRAANHTPAPLAVIAALIGPAVPVAALAVVARLTG